MTWTYETFKFTSHDGQAFPIRARRRDDLDIVDIGAGIAIQDVADILRKPAEEEILRLWIGGRHILTGPGGIYWVDLQGFSALLHVRDGYRTVRDDLKAFFIDFLQPWIQGFEDDPPPIFHPEEDGAVPEPLIIDRLKLVSLGLIDATTPA
jgi:hypothetical protein